jgi:hypothetical protein
VHDFTGTNADSAIPAGHGRVAVIDSRLPLLYPFTVCVGISLVVANAGPFAGVLDSLSLQLNQTLSGRYVADVRWVEGYNAWCARWAAAQSSPGSPIG